MAKTSTRYFLARRNGVWHLILHALTGACGSDPSCASQPLDPVRRPGDDAARSDDGGPMKITPWYLAALAPFAAIGCSGAYLGHAAVVLLTVGIFLGTLSLGRAPSAPSEPPRIS